LAWFKSLGARVTLFTKCSRAVPATSDVWASLSSREAGGLYVAKCYPGLNQVEFFAAFFPGSLDARTRRISPRPHRGPHSRQRRIHARPNEEEALHGLREFLLFANQGAPEESGGVEGPGGVPEPGDRGDRDLEQGLHGRWDRAASGRR